MPLPRDCLGPGRVAGVPMDRATVGFSHGSKSLQPSKAELQKARFDAAANLHTVQMGRHRDLPDAAFLAPLVKQACAALGTDTYAAIVIAGRALSYEEAVAEMTQWLKDLTLTA